MSQESTYIPLRPSSALPPGDDENPEISEIKSQRGYADLPVKGNSRADFQSVFPGFQRPKHQKGYPAPPPGYEHPLAHGFPAGPIRLQPERRVPVTAGGLMSIPQGITNCPPGLEYLSTIDQLYVLQNVNSLKAFIGDAMHNKYLVMNNLGQNLYYAVEDNDCCTQCCCGPARPFQMKILDNFRKEVIHLNRPMECCLDSMEVTAPPGTVIGSIEQEWSICKPCYVIKDASGEVVLRIKGPVCTWSCCGEDVNFNVYSRDSKTKVGKITRHFSGLVREIFTNTDDFGISFPMDLDVRIKAVLLGACFLIDFMYFEPSK